MDKLMIITKGKPMFKAGDETGKSFNVRTFNIVKDVESGNQILSFKIKFKDENNKPKEEDVVLNIEEDLLALSVNNIPIFPIVSEEKELVEIDLNGNDEDDELSYTEED